MHILDRIDLVALLSQPDHTAEVQKLLACSCESVFFGTDRFRSHTTVLVAEA